MFDVTKRYCYIQKLISDYWSKFRKIFLNDLDRNIIHSKHSPCSKSSSNKKIVPCIGELVLVKDDTYTPRGYCRLGKVSSLKLVEIAVPAISKMVDQVSCYRSIQKLISFEINEIIKDEISERCSAGSRELREFMSRGTATEGNFLNKSHDIYG